MKIYPKKYPFYVLDIEENRVINGFDSKSDCYEFILDLIPVDELTQKEIKEEKENYKILTHSNLQLKYELMFGN